MNTYTYTHYLGSVIVEAILLIITMVTGYGRKIVVVQVIK